MAIDVKNTRWAVYRKSTKTVLSRRNLWPVKDGGPIVDQDPDYVWLKHVHTQMPDYNEYTQKIVYSEKTNLTTKTITDVWTIEDLTEEEKENSLPEHFETSSGLKLKTDVSSQNAFTRMMAMIDLAGMTGSTKVKVQHVYGDVNEITVIALKTELQEYAEYCYTQFLVLE